MSCQERGGTKALIPPLSWPRGDPKIVGSCSTAAQFSHAAALVLILHDMMAEVSF